MSREPIQRERVLVVDDDLALVDTLADGLSDLGYEVVGTGSSLEAKELLEQHTFDALLTDLRMPGLDGLGLLAVSRKLSRERPVIVMTAYSAVDAAVEAVRRGACDYLTKPFKVRELGLCLARALAKRSPPHESSHR